MSWRTIGNIDFDKAMSIFSRPLQGFKFPDLKIMGIKHKDCYYIPFRSHSDLSKSNDQFYIINYQH